MSDRSRVHSGCTKPRQLSARYSYDVLIRKKVRIHSNERSAFYKRWQRPEFLRHFDLLIIARQEGGTQSAGLGNPVRWMRLQSHPHYNLLRDANAPLIAWNDIQPMPAGGVRTRSDRDE
jgi:hypothetical protein